MRRTTLAWKWWWTLFAIEIAVMGVSGGIVGRGGIVVAMVAGTVGYVDGYVQSRLDRRSPPGPPIQGFRTVWTRKEEA